MSTNVTRTVVFVMVARKRASIFVEATTAHAQMVIFWRPMEKIVQVLKIVAVLLQEETQTKRNKHCPLHRSVLIQCQQEGKLN